MLSRMGRKIFKLFATIHTWKRTDSACVWMWIYMHVWVNAALCEVTFLPSYRSRHSACKPEHIRAKVCLNTCISRGLIINEGCSFAVCLNGETEVPWAYFRWLVFCVFLGKYKSKQLWMIWSAYTWKGDMCVVCMWVTRSTHEHEQVSAEAGIYTLVKHQQQRTTYLRISKERIHSSLSECDLA